MSRFGEAERGQHVEAGIVELRAGESRSVLVQNSSPKRPFVEGELDVEGRGRAPFSTVASALVVEALARSARG